MPITLPQVTALRKVLDQAMFDSVLLAKLCNPATSTNTLKTSLNAQEYALVKRLEPIVFKQLGAPGYCIAPEFKGMVIVIAPSPDAVKSEIVGLWPEGSSPDKPGCQTGSTRPPKRP